MRFLLLFFLLMLRLLLLLVFLLNLALFGSGLKQLGKYAGNISTATDYQAAIVQPNLPGLSLYTYKLLIRFR